MVRIAPVRLAYNPKTLWFDAADLDLSDGDNVIVRTARGSEYGIMAGSVFEASEEQISQLKSPLKPVKRIATDEDTQKANEMFRLSKEAMPEFRSMAAETLPDINPVAVEYLFDQDKAVFYFEAEERVDFRELVRKLAARFHVHVDMKQIGVRDKARMMGGLGSCGEELCCGRFGGSFNPVSIRMAKEQNLSLNPQKISGACGRLMCCLRYEYDAYKEFHERAPKKNARIQTPEGIAKVVDEDVPREMISLQLDEGKPVKVKLADMYASEDGKKPDSIGEEAWEAAKSPVSTDAFVSLLFSDKQLVDGDELADPSKVRHVGGSSKQGGKGKRKGSSSAKQGNGQATSTRKARRRRSIKVGADGAEVVTEAPKNAEHKQASGGQKQGQKHRNNANGKAEAGKGQKSKQGKQGKQQQKQGSKPKQQANNANRKNAPGRNSSGLRTSQNGAENKQHSGEGSSNNAPAKRKRRRSHKASATTQQGNATMGNDKPHDGGAQGARSSGEKPHDGKPADND